MRAGTQRPPSRRWRAPARGALLASGLWLAAAGVHACEGGPHGATEMPDTLSNPWTGGGVSLAWYDGPTTRYPHGVLGDAVEATRLHAYAEGAPGPCGAMSAILPDDLVFEDTAPRLADLDHDGRAEIVVVESHQNRGARLAVYRATADGTRLDRVATTPFIGRRNRWLAPVGIGDLDGDGHIDIAYVDRPHLARTLRVWLFAGDTLTEIAALDGLTNHRIGEPFITGGLRDCGDGPELVTADAGWSSVMATRFEDGRLVARPLAPFSAEAVAAALTCRS